MEELFERTEKLYVTCKKCGHEIPTAVHVNRQGKYTHENVLGEEWCSHCETFFKWDGRQAHFKDGEPFIKVKLLCPNCEKKLFLTQPFERCPYCGSELPKQ